MNKNWNYAGYGRKTAEKMWESGASSDKNHLSKFSIRCNRRGSVDDHKARAGFRSDLNLITNTIEAFAGTLNERGLLVEYYVPDYEERQQHESNRPPSVWVTILDPNRKIEKEN
jgi:hypothetical protein